MAGAYNLGHHSKFFASGASLMSFLGTQLADGRVWRVQNGFNCMSGALARTAGRLSSAVPVDQRSSLTYSPWPSRGGQIFYMDASTSRGPGMTFYDLASEVTEHYLFGQSSLKLAQI